ncbi:MAG: hypothetical protein ACJ71S_06445 [Acidobacteriaceae bacterium]|jgi:hypothetical protein
MSNMPAGVLAILPNSITGRGLLQRVERCAVCERDVEYNRDCGKWYFEDSLLVECVPTWVGKAFLCSDRCQSQHYWNLGTEKDRELLSALARFCHAWQENEIAPESHDWCLQHLHAGLAVTHFTLRTLHQGVEELLRDLAGQGYLDGKDDPPQWFMDATDVLAPDVEMVRKGLGVACVNHEKDGAA